MSFSPTNMEQYSEKFDLNSIFKTFLQMTFQLGYAYAEIGLV